MTEAQVLFRIDASTLADLDRAIERLGFRTRNAWFRRVVRETLARSR